MASLLEHYSLPLSDSELITMCILALRYEAQHYNCKLDDCLLKQVISHARTKARERSERNAEEALAKASLVLEK